MDKDSATTRCFIGGGAMTAFVLFAVALLHYSNAEREFSDAVLTEDLMWLDAWAIASVFSLAAIWILPVAQKTKAWLSILWLSLYGFIAVSVIFSGADFGFNAYGGDQSFRQAMVLKFMTLSWFGDFYFKSLPDFYPPVYYIILAAYGKLFSIPAYRTLLDGHKLLYLAAPVLSYWMWTRVTSRLKAFLITLLSVLYCGFEKGIPLNSPPAFLGNLLFIPWWLYYIEIERPMNSRWKDLLGGGVIGALIFATYPYAFLPGLFLIFVRSVLLRTVSWLRPWFRLQEKRALAVLLATALFSAPYWLPPLISILRYGGKPADQEWLHLGHLGLEFAYLGPGLLGVLFAAGLGYLLWRRNKPIHRGILLLWGSILILYMAGSISGALYHPFNIPKLKELYLFLFGPVVGIGAATFLRWASRRRHWRFVLPVLGLLALLPFFQTFDDFAKHPFVRRAREATVRVYDLPSEVAPGSVVLAADMTLPSFYPVYTMIVTNQHYAHSASQWTDRYNLLCLLQDIRDPYLFNLVLRHSIFGPTDFFMPRVASDGSFELLLNLSSYPTKSIFRTLNYSRAVVGDTRLFERISDENIYRVITPADSEQFASFSDFGMTARDTATSLFRVQLIGKYLDSTGQSLLERHLERSWGHWNELRGLGDPVRMSNSIGILSSSYVETADSVYFLLACKEARDVDREYKIYLHFYDGHSDQPSVYDFYPGRSTATWKQGDIVLCCRSFPRPRENVRFTCGFYNDEGRYGSAFNGSMTFETNRTQASR